MIKGLRPQFSVAKPYDLPAYDLPAYDLPAYDLPT